MSTDPVLPLLEESSLLGSYFTALVAAGSVFWEYAATCLKDLRQAPIRKGILLFHLMGFAWPQDCLV